MDPFHMNFHIDVEIGLQLLISFILGAAIGLEREYNSKAAGLRTMIMICLGSTIFTELSMMLGGDNPDRIAANIVTGVGFLGAGVIFKDGLSITGITTATTIWIAAALGMAVGAGEYFIAVVSTGVIIIVLSVFNKIQLWVERINQTHTYRITFTDINDQKTQTEIETHPLQFYRKRTIKEKGKYTVFYEVTGSQKKLVAFTQYLKQNNQIESFEY